VPYLVEEGGSLMGTKGTHDVLRDYSAYLHSIAPMSFTVGEVWDSVGAMLPYYPDQLDSYFAFALSDALISGVRSGSAKGMLDSYMRLQNTLPGTRWSPFLRNHDQTRTLTELKGDVAKAKVAATLLLTLPGFPFVYYGEEIGMTGDKPDERLRTPMQWTQTQAGFTSGKPWETLQGDTLTANVASEDRDAGSLLNRYRALIRLRETHAALGATAKLIPLAASSDAVVAYLRQAEGRAIMVVANLGDQPLTRVTLTSPALSLDAGSYSTPALLGGTPAQFLNVRADGSIRSWVPFTTLAPRQAYVVELVSEH
jgi:glycosidase